jgi:hypothetical protein
MKNTQEFGLAAIVATVCLSFFATVILSAIGRPVAPELQGVINTTFVAFAVVVPTWLQANRSEKAKGEAYQSGMVAQAGHYAAAMREYEGLKVGK